MYEKIIEALEVLVVGLAGVFSVLSFFSIMIWFLKWADSKLSKKKVEAPILKVQKEFFETRTEGELVAVITAAAMEIFKSKVKIHKIHFLNDASKPSNWASSGRVNVMASHNLNLKG